MHSYGKVKKETGEKNFIPFLYQGQYKDVETGLCYNRFRYYFIHEGMYVGQQDPIGLSAGKLNIYSYVDEPNAYIDPLGLEGGIGSWNEFLKGTKGTFNKAGNLAGDGNVMKDASSAWTQYKSNFSSSGTPVIGGLEHTSQYIGKDGFNVLNSGRWNLNVNDAWVQGGIDRKANFDLVSPRNSTFLWDAKNMREKVFQRELDMLKKSGYIEKGDKMIHPDNIRIKCK